MIIAGNKQEFAIEAEITVVSESWILGHFRFFFHGQPCGNWDDDADLNGCCSWLKDFADNPRNRYEPDLLKLSPSKIFELLVDPVVADNLGSAKEEVYPGTFSRFHIAHLGMSSFDRVAMVLIETSNLQRCIWQDGIGQPLRDDSFSAGYMEKVADEFCKEFAIKGKG